MGATLKWNRGAHKIFRDAISRSNFGVFSVLAITKQKYRRIRCFVRRHRETAARTKFRDAIFRASFCLFLVFAIYETEISGAACLVEFSIVIYYLAAKIWKNLKKMKKMKKMKKWKKMWLWCYNIFSESSVFLKPPNLSFNEAATIQACILTAYRAVSVFANPTPGQRALVIGASRGVY